MMTHMIMIMIMIIKVYSPVNAAGPQLSPAGELLPRSSQVWHSAFWSSELPLLHLCAPSWAWGARPERSFSSPGYFRRSCADVVFDDVLRFLSVHRAANARAGEAFALRETPPYMTCMGCLGTATPSTILMCCCSCCCCNGNCYDCYLVHYLLHCHRSCHRYYYYYYYYYYYLLTTY